jgi:hypothetical protein
MVDYNATPSYYSLNNSKLFNNRQFIESLYRGIQAGLKRPLSNGEKRHLQDTLRQEMPSKFRDKSPGDILNIYTKALTDRFKQNSCVYDRIDTHELNKSQIGLVGDISVSDFGTQAAQSFSTQTVEASVTGAVSVNNFLGMTDLSRILASINPTTSIKTEYITLDSRYRSLDNDGTLYFKWNAVYDNSDIQGGFNINQRVRDVVAIKCYPIKMPYVSTADNDYGRITLLFQEFQSQSFVAHENTKYHYVFASDVQDRWIHLRTHNYNDGVFKFATPLTQLSSLTVSLASPLQPIIFDADRQQMVVSDYTTNNKTYFSSVGTHNLETGDLVYISEFNTTNPASDAVVIGAVNTRYGNKITYISDTVFYIDVDSTSVFEQGPGQASVVNASNSIIGTGGTNFVTLFSIGDSIEVNGQKLVVTAILSNSSLTTSTPYTGITGTYNYSIDNRIPGLQVYVYFGSKRLLLNFEIAYIDSGINHQ